MKYEEYDQWQQAVDDENARRMEEHVSQTFARARLEGRLGIVYGMTAEQLRTLVNKGKQTLHGEDCAFLWACGIRADQDLCPTR